MENKQIIINGFNLECIKELLYNGKRSAISTNIFEAIIEELERKEQECEELKEKYKWYDYYKEQALYNKNLCNEKSEQLDQFKARNEELKAQNIKYMNGNISYQLKNSLYKQTLAEIKEIAEWHTTSSDSEDVQEDMKQILQKISECEVENES